MSRHVVHITDFYTPGTGGIETQVAALAARQAAQGDRVTVVTSTPGRGADGAVSVLRADAPGRLGVHTRPRNLLATGDAVLGLDPDVVHTHASGASPLAAAVMWRASRAGVPTAVTVHSMLAWAQPVYRALDAGWSWADCPVAWSAVSSVAAEPVRRLTGAAVDVLPNAIDLAWWAGPPHPAPRPLTVVSVGRLAGRKRVLPLLALLRDVRAALPAEVPLRAVLVGDGPQRTRLERYLRRHGMQGWVELAGSRTPAEVRTLLHRCDVYVAPAALESFGIAALEARCAGVPVVARSASGVTEFVTDGVEGLLAADDAGVGRSVLRLLADAPLRTRIAQHNRATLPLLDWGRNLARTEALYRRAADLQGRAASPAGSGAPAAEPVDDPAGMAG